MQCKNCGYPGSSVVKTTHNDFKNLIERRRECLRCGLRFTTHEKLREPKQGKAEDVDRTRSTTKRA